MKLKKLIVLLIVMALPIYMQLQANPLPSPPTEFFVSELAFDSEGKWVMELNAFHDHYLLDSIIIKSSSGRVKWNGLSQDEDGRYIYQEMILLRNDSLDSGLNINPNGDYIEITSYNQGYDSINHRLIFGNYADAFVRSPLETESIVWAAGFYCIDRTPTIGSINDAEGMYGAAKFNIYYPSGELFADTYAALSDENSSGFSTVTKNSDGSYSGNLYYCNLSFEKLFLRSYNGQYYDYWSISQPVAIRMDDPENWDKENSIQIELSLFTSVQTINTDESILKIYPNPISGKSFYYETTLPVKSANSRIEISGLNGQIIAHYPISQNKDKITLPSNIVNGVYNVTLIINSKKYIVSKVIVE